MKVPLLQRDALSNFERIAPDTEADYARYAISVSSNEPVLVWDEERGRVVREILRHEKDAIDLRYATRGLSGLMDHTSSDQVSIMEDLEVEDGMLRGKARFSKSDRGKDIERDVRDGIRPYVSIGYAPLRGHSRVVHPGDDKTPPTIERTKWLLFEYTHTSTPADPKPGPGRNRFVEIDDGASVVEGRTRAMGDDVRPTEANGGGAPSTATATATAEAATRAERERCSEIRAIANASSGKIDDKTVERWINEGVPLATVSREALTLLTTRGVVGGPANPVEPGSVPNVIVPKARSYSVARAIQSQLRRNRVNDDFGFELEVSQELSKRYENGVAPHGGVVIPSSKRVMDSITATKGTETVFETPGEMIEMLKAALIVTALGATIRTDLKGPVAFPKKTGALTATWMSENPPAAAPTSDLAFGQVVLTPKTLIVTTKFSRQLLNQSSIAIDEEVKRDIVEEHALAIDRAVFHGTGANAQPMGIYASPDVQAKAMGGVPSFALLVDMIGLALDKNPGPGSFGWATTPLMQSVFMKTLEASAAGASFIWKGIENESRMIGYKAMSSNVISKVMNGSDPTGGTSHGLVFGKFSDVLIGMFGAQEIIVDEITLADFGLIKITSFQMTDIALRHGELFVKATGATIA